MCAYIIKNCIWRDWHGTDSERLLPIDASRIVLVEGGEADCDFEVCAYRDVCQIGQQIAQLQKTEERT